MVSIALGKRLPVKVIDVTRRVTDYNPDQPRAPKGDPEGGQWISATGEATGQEHEGTEFKVIRSMAGLEDAFGGEEGLELAREFDDVVDFYTSIGSGRINELLRDGDDTGRYSEEIARLDAYIAKSQLHEDLVVFRGFGPTGWSAFISGASVGDVVQDNGYVSTSASAEIGQMFGRSENRGYAEILVPKGSAAAQTIEGSHPGEFEVLLARGAEFQVLAMDEKRVRLLYMGPSQ